MAAGRDALTGRHRSGGSARRARKLRRAPLALTRFVHDVCAIIVSHNGKPWLERGAGQPLRARRRDRARRRRRRQRQRRLRRLGRGALSRRRARSRCENRGFGHANNRGLETADARYVLFLNPDTEFLDGSLAELVAALDRRPDVGLAGRAPGRRGDGSLAPSIRRFPSAANMLAEALGVERVPRRAGGCWASASSTRADYARETPCDWTSGSFMLARREALDATAAASTSASSSSPRRPTSAGGSSGPAGRSSTCRR